MSDTSANHAATTDKMARKRRAFVFRVTFLFFVFCLIAAPLQYHYQWYVHLNNDVPSFFLAPLNTGILYFYTIILLVEALFRLEAYPELHDFDHPVMWLCRGVCIALIITSVLAILLFRQYLQPTPPGNLALVAQLGIAIVAIVFAVVINYAITGHEAKHIR